MKPHHIRLHSVMAGLDPAIHEKPAKKKTWMPGSSPGMTDWLAAVRHA
jgi:hypothetical protein